MRIDRRLLNSGLLAGAAIGLAGCLRPLHAPDALGAAAGASGNRVLMSDVVIDLQGDRLAHYFRSELEFALRGGAPAPTAGSARYRLEVSVSQVIGSSLIDRVSGLADGANLTATAGYTLKPIGRSEAIDSGRVITSIAYERSQQRFASVRASRDAEIQAAQQLAEQIRARLIAKLSG